MFKIIGADDKEYGPASLDQVKQWLTEGRINTRTRILPEGSTEWKTVGEIPELQGIGLRPPPLPASTPAAGALPGAPTGAALSQGLAITSFVLGLLSLLCFGPFAGLPAIICGHIAYNRTRRAPAQYGGGGFSIAGFVMGYVSILLIPIMAAMLFPALARAKSRAQSINCVNNMKQIGLAMKTWALDHEDKLPFEVSTNQGGTMGLSSGRVDANGFDSNPVVHFIVLSNELVTARILVCPADSSKQEALGFDSLGPQNISYRLRTGGDAATSNPQAVLAVCPVHGHELMVDGSVRQVRGYRPGQPRPPL